MPLRPLARPTSSQARMTEPRQSTQVPKTSKTSARIESATTTKRSRPGGYPETVARRQVNIAIVGTGFIAETRARAYAGVTGHEPRLVAAVSRTRARLDDYARRHAIDDVYTELGPVLERKDVEVVDLCVPNHLHRPMTELAAAAGKHVIC